MQEHKKEIFDRHIFSSPGKSNLDWPIFCDNADDEPTKRNIIISKSCQTSVQYSLFVSINNNKTLVMSQFNNPGYQSIKSAANERWSSPTISTAKKTFHHPTYNTRYLARDHLGSTTNDFSLTINNHIDSSLHSYGISVTTFTWIISLLLKP